MRYENGDKYVGEWRRGLRHGYGCLLTNKKSGDKKKLQ
eukprot:gene38501-47547_t